MQTDEIAKAVQQYRSRVEAVLSPDQLACFDTYQRRVQAALDRGDSAPIVLAPGEQAVLDQIATDTQAVALRTQLDALLRIETLPQ